MEIREDVFRYFDQYKSTAFIDDRRSDVIFRSMGKVLNLLRDVIIKLLGD